MSARATAHVTAAVAKPAVIAQGPINPADVAATARQIDELVEAGLKRAGVPVLNLEVDCVDPRNFSEGQLRTRLQAFMELLQDRRNQRRE
jgi:hypothetical protein